MESGSHIRLIFGKANRAVEEVDRRSICHTGLSITDFMILEALLHKGPLPINEIGKKILLTSGSMTAAANPFSSGSHIINGCMVVGEISSPATQPTNDEMPQVTIIIRLVRIPIMRAAMLFC